MRPGICNYQDASFNTFAVVILLLRSLDFQSSLLSLGKLKASFRMLLLLRSLTVAAHELINTTCGVNELALTSIERVRGAGDFDFYHWVSFAFELYGVIRLCSRLRKEHIAVGHILEYDGAIVVWMNTFFHFELNINVIITIFA